jgi:hypothetical protein
MAVTAVPPPARHVCLPAQAKCKLRPLPRLQRNFALRSRVIKSAANHDGCFSRWNGLLKLATGAEPVLESRAFGNNRFVSRKDDNRARYHLPGVGIEDPTNDDRIRLCLADQGSCQANPQ